MPVTSRPMEEIAAREIFRIMHKDIVSMTNEIKRQAGPASTDTPVFAPEVDNAHQQLKMLSKQCIDHALEFTLTHEHVTQHRQQFQTLCNVAADPLPLKRMLYERMWIGLDEIASLVQKHAERKRQHDEGKRRFLKDVGLARRDAFDKKR